HPPALTPTARPSRMQASSSMSHAAPTYDPKRALFVHKTGKALEMPCCARVIWLLALCLTTSAAGQTENWPGWRGPRGDGTSLETNTPTRWNGETGVNLAWKVPV